MKSLLWFLFGVAGGVTVAHFVNRDPRGHEVLAQIDSRISEFTDRIGSAYRDQEARFSHPLSEARVAAVEAADAVAQQAADAATSVPGATPDSSLGAADSPRTTA